MKHTNRFRSWFILSNCGLKRTQNLNRSQNLVGVLAAVLPLSLLAPPQLSWAGASASQWVLVVNAESVSSRTVANHFCQIRDIPSANVIVLQDVPDQDQISLAEFKARILVPVLEQIQSRRLANHIQGIAYSTDFPTAVSVSDDTKRIPNLSKHLTPMASINGLTFFYRHILANSPAYLSLEANQYASRPGTMLFKPVLSTSERLQKLNSNLAAKEWTQAADLIQLEANSLPKELRNPMHIIEAQLRMKGGELDLAENCLEKGVQEGWAYKRALEDEIFDPIRDRPDMIATLSKCDDVPFDYTPFRGFDARSSYAANSLSAYNSKLGVNYMLSAVLGVSRDFGITRFEVIEGLKRSARADFNTVEGTFLFSKTDDVRTTARASHFNNAIERLRMKGLEARMIASPLPRQREKVAGLMVGAPNLAIASSGAELMPGSIAENLTSFGGAMTNPSQTKATEFLRNGAAGSSGTVHEPYAILNKFPHPMIHDAYTDGLTLAEAFYGNVLCPYQLLIVGDPLCQPFAIPPRFEAKLKSTVIDRSQGITLEIASETDGQDIDSLTLTLDGVSVGEIVYKSQIALDLSDVTVGWHELRIISKDKSPIQTRYEQKIVFQVVDKSEKSGELSWGCEPPRLKGNITVVPFVVDGAIPDQEYEIWHHQELYTTVPYGSTEFEISYKDTGHGPARFHLRQRIDVNSSIATNVQIIESK